MSVPVTRTHRPHPPRGGQRPPSSSPASVRRCRGVDAEVLFVDDSDGRHPGPDQGRRAQQASALRVQAAAPRSGEQRVGGLGGRRRRGPARRR